MGRHPWVFPSTEEQKRGFPWAHWSLWWQLSLEQQPIMQLRAFMFWKQNINYFFYADDVLLLTTKNTETMLPYCLRHQWSLSLMSGYRIHCGKCVLECPLTIRKNWWFKWLPSSLVYLGIRITSGLKNIMAENSPKM